MSYVALYRKYRPTSWDKVYGQKAVTQTLRNQVTTGKVGHAYLLSGPRGTGKTTVAKIFASAVNCASPVNGDPCMACDVCKATIAGCNTDIVELDAASNNGVDDIRAIIDESKYLPQNGKYRVYIIDEVHMLSKSAFNALLKTLEEPPQGIIFILATTEINKVPATIRSRCQHFQFRLISLKEISTVLKEVCQQEGLNQYDYDDDALDYIAKLADGGMRNAICILDQCITSGAGKITKAMVQNMFGDVDDEVVVNIANCIDNRDSATVFSIIEDQIQNGRDLVTLSTKLYNLFKDRFFHNQQDELLQRNVKILGDVEEKMRWNKNRTTLEVGILSLCNPSMEASVSCLTEKLDSMDRLLKRMMIELPTAGGEYTVPLMNVPNVPKALPNTIPDMNFTISKRPSIIRAFYS